jgi:hypothetical protein
MFAFFRHAMALWKYIALVVPSVILTIILYFSFKCSGMYDTEYLGYYITKTSYYEPWNEYIHRTCTREVYEGTDSDGNPKYRTEEYDCYYVEYHPAHWTYNRNCSNYEVEISHAQYDQICAKFGTPKRFVDMHRHYHTIDGDCYECHFNGDRNRMWTLTEKGKYKNKILKSKSIFNFSEVTEKDKTDYRLFDYPRHDYINDQCPVISEISVPKCVVDSFKYLNAYYGSKYQFRVYVLIWRNAPIETSTYQQDYWVGGNKNELCVTASVDNYGNIQWIRSFSWEDKPDMVVGVNHLYENGEKLDLMKLNRYLLRTVPSKWKRKAFADFDYINVMLTNGQWIAMLVIITILNIVCCIVFGTNDATEKDSIEILGYDKKCKFL